MSKNNKSIKDAMIKKYGKKCFIEALGLRSQEEIEKDLAKYKKSKRKELCMLTYHHIRERCRGGDATEENGAILRNINHMWFNGLSRERQCEINKLFQEYKLNFLNQAMQSVHIEPEKNNNFMLGVVELYNGNVIQAEKIDLEEREDLEQEIIIPVFDIEIGSEEYNKYIKLRRERERAKWREWGYDDSDWER